MTLDKRLKDALEGSGISKSDLARAVGISTASIANWFNGRTKSIKGENLTRAAKALNVNEAWLAGQSPVKERIGFAKYEVRYLDKDSDTEVMIKQYRDVRWAAGTGSVNEHPGEIDHLAFKRSYMERNGLKADACIAAAATGDSMSPTINDGDIMLINLAEKDLQAKDGKIFAFAVGDECRVKRVYTTMNGDVRLVSDNPDKIAYPDEIIPASEANSLHVAGRVRWSGGDK